MINIIIMNRISLIVPLLIAFSITSNAQKNAEKRLSLAKEFVEAFIEPRLSNVHIMQKYVDSGNYFKVDSIRQLADRWMDHQRNNMRTVKREDMEVLEYLRHEKEFMEMDNPPGKPLSPPALQKLKFSLGTSEGHDLYVDLDDLYVVTENSKAIMFILFNEDDKIITFSGLRFDSQVNLWQW